MPCHAYSPVRRIAASCLGFAAAAALLGAVRPAQAAPTWALVYSNPNSGNVLSGISAVDATHAWAVGVESNMGNSTAVGRFTTDGVNWSPMMLPPPIGSGMEFTLFFYPAFADSTRGWLSGAHISMAAQETILWSTTNAGLSWTQAYTVAGTDLLESVQALPTGELFAAGGTRTVRCTDGVTYLESSPTLPGSHLLKGIHMLNPSCGFAVAATDPDATAASSAVYWTGDGAATWEERASGLSASLVRLWFVSPSLGWAAGEDRSGRGVVARTTDGGRNWTVVNLPDHPAPPLATDPVPVDDCADVRFFDDLRGLALCTACTANCEPGATDDPSLMTMFARTTDGGASWTMDPDYEPVMNAAPFGELMKFSGMMAMSFPDPNNGFLTGQNNLVLRYTAAQPEPAGWATDSCTEGGGAQGSGGGSGAGGGGTGNGSAAGGDDADSDSGCGCALPGARPTAGGALALLGLGAAARRRRLRARGPLRQRQR